MYLRRRTEPVVFTSSDPGLIPPVQCRLHGHRLCAGVLHVDLQMILQVFADAGKVVDHIDPVVAVPPGPGGDESLRGGGIRAQQ